MKILVLSAVLPYPLDSGGKVRIYHLLKRLSTQHEIHLCTFLRTSQEEQYVQSLPFLASVTTMYRGTAWQANHIARSFASSYPLLMATYASARMRETISRLHAAHGFDLIHVEPGYAWPSVPNLGIPVVIAEHNIEHTVYEAYVRRFQIVPLRPLLYLDVLKLSYWERRVWRAADHIITVSTEDRDRVRSHTDTEVTVVENGVDTRDLVWKPKKISKKSYTFLFVGNFSWVQNTDAASMIIDSIWPMLSGAVPGSKLRIVGKRAPAWLTSKASQAGVELIHGVKEIRDEYYKADCLLAPIRIGGGTKFKILEAMACGVPVVTTTMGAAGMPLRHGDHAMIADSVDEIIDGCKKIATDTKLRSSIIKKARQLVDAEYSWDTIAAKQDTVWCRYEK